MANGVTPDHFDVVVVGAGSGGLTAAKTSARFGAKVLLVERLPRLGGDCTWFGCVPSKALIRCAHACHEARCAARFGVKGIETKEVSCDWQQVKQHIKSCQEKIYKQDDSPEVLEAAGVQVRLGCHASFRDAHQMQLTRDSDSAGSDVVTADRFILCTGAGPALPPLKGLDAVPFFTYETIFDLDVLPSSLAVIGGGPIGSELAQAMARLGSQVTLVGKLMPREDDDVRKVMSQVFQRVVLSGGRIVGATVVSQGAGEIASELGLAISKKMKCSDIARCIHSYPSMSFALQQLAAEEQYAKLEKSQTLKCLRGLFGLRLHGGK